MPFKSEKIIIAGSKFDRRIKLTEEQRVDIVRLREEENLSYSKLATMFGVSKRLIQFILKPDIKERCAQQFRQRRKDGRYYNKETWKDTMNEHRRYKQNLYINNKIK